MSNSARFVGLILNLCVISFSAAEIASAQEWPRFRGLNGSGVSEAATVPTAWTEKDFNWRIELPGVGHSSPVVWGTKLFLNAEERDGAERVVLRVNTADGKVEWTRKFASQSYKKHKNNSYASSTPAVDAERVYVAWAVPEKITLLALDHNGSTAWEADLGPFKSGHGFAASPIVFDDLVVIGNDQEGASSAIAVDRRTGKIAWTAPRKSERTTYSTPVVFQPLGRPAELVFTQWRHGFTAIDPKTGKTNWEISVFDQSREERAIGSPIVAGDMIVGTCGFVTAQKHFVAVKPGASGNAVDVREVFRIEKAVPHVPTTLYYKDRLYLWNDQGIVTCVDAKSGKEIWQERVGGNYFGSPVCVAGRLFCASDAGEVIVLAAADEFKELARNPLGEPCHSTPAIANGTMFIRTASHLLAMGGKK